MKKSVRSIANGSRRFGITIGFWLSITVVSWACTQHLIANAFQKGTSMPSHANGTFEVKLTTQTDGADATLGRMTIDKQFHGDLEGTSKGQMLTGMSEMKGSGAYVAIEKVTGTLKGRSGIFILQHTGTMNRGVPELKVTVVPDSGTGQLAGLTGNFKIIITEGKHSYEFEYTLPESH
jgi:Protein of unknown function (DUF3224)